jgi:hypothetical protein
MGEASDVLREMSIPHAAIDLDAVCVNLFPDSTTKDIDLRNAAALYTNCVAAGVDKILIAAAIECAESLRLGVTARL